MVILVGECGSGKSSIERALIEKFGYEKMTDTDHIFARFHEAGRKKKVCTLTPEEVRKLRVRKGRRLENDIDVFYIKVSRRDRLIRMFQRGDDIDEVFSRDKTDMERYRDIEKEADFVLPNRKNFSDPENMAYWITECVNGNFYKSRNG